MVKTNLEGHPKNIRVTVDDINQNIFLDEQDNLIGITEFLTALRVNTK